MANSFGLRLGGEKRRLNRRDQGKETEQNASQPQTEAAAMRLLERMQLVTSAAFVQRKGCGREGEGGDRHPCSGANAALVTAALESAKFETAGREVDDRVSLE
jgi:hypothetical protein